MANDLNRAVLVGRLVRDPELKSTSGGTYFCRFTLASNYSAKSGDSYVDKVNFIDCIAWGKSAEALHKYAQKGHRVAVDGALRWSSWEAEGKKHSKVEIQVEAFQFLQPKKDGGQSEPQGDPAAAAHFEGTDDDIPF